MLIQTRPRAYTTVEFFRNPYIVRDNITRVYMSLKGHIVYMQNTNTHGEKHVGNQGKYDTSKKSTTLWLTLHFRSNNRTNNEHPH